MVNQWQIDTLKDDEQIVINKHVPFKTKLKRKIFGNRIKLKLVENGKVHYYDSEDVAIVKKKDMTTVSFSCLIYDGIEPCNGTIVTNGFSTSFVIKDKNISLTVETSLIKELYNEIIKREDGFYDKE